MALSKALPGLLLLFSTAQSRWCKGVDFQHGDFPLDGCTILDFAGASIGDAGTREVAARLRNNSELTLLSFVGNGLSAEACEALSAVLQGQHALSVLSLAENGIGGRGAKALLEVLGHGMGKPMAVDVASNAIGEEGALMVAEALKGNAGLAALDLATNEVGEGGARALAGALQVNTALTELDLGSNGVGDVGAIALARALKSNAGLTWLDLSANSLGDMGVKAFARVLGSRGLATKLSLGENVISDEGAAALAKAMRQHGSLTFLDLQSNRISSHGAWLLAEAAGHEASGMRDSGHSCGAGLLVGWAPPGHCALRDCQPVQTCGKAGGCRWSDCKAGWLPRWRARMPCKDLVCTLEECCVRNPRSEDLVVGLARLEHSELGVRLTAAGLAKELFEDRLATDISRGELIELLLEQKTKFEGYCANVDDEERGHCEASGLYASVLLALAGVMPPFLLSWGAVSFAAHRSRKTSTFDAVSSGLLRAARGTVIAVATVGLMFTRLPPTMEGAFGFIPLLRGALRRVLLPAMPFAAPCLKVISAVFLARNALGTLEFAGSALQLSALLALLALAATADRAARGNALCHISGPLAAWVLLRVALNLPMLRQPCSGFGSRQHRGKSLSKVADAPSGAQDKDE